MLGTSHFRFIPLPYSFLSTGVKFKLYENIIFHAGVKLGENGVQRKGGIKMNMETDVWSSGMGVGRGDSNPTL
jgi:hypothetical protein